MSLKRRYNPSPIVGAANASASDVFVKFGPASEVQQGPSDLYGGAMPHFPSAQPGSLPVYQPASPSIYGNPFPETDSFMGGLHSHIKVSPRLPRGAKAASIVLVNDPMQALLALTPARMDSVGTMLQHIASARSSGDGELEALASRELKSLLAPSGAADNAFEIEPAPEALMKGD